MVAVGWELGHASPVHMHSPTPKVVGATLSFSIVKMW